jgi:LacI family transcriptional regulator
MHQQPWVEMQLRSEQLSRHLAFRRTPSSPLKNSATIAVFQAPQRLKVSIPSGVALLGIDDFELASTLRPAISVVQQPLENDGRKAAELLFAQLDRTPGSVPSSRLNIEPVVFANRLVLRRSCGCKMRGGSL